jgi:hypothetical protein
MPGGQGHHPARHHFIQRRLDMSINNFKVARTINIYEVARREHFRLGVADYRAGAGWREITNSQASLDYERGRQFAAYYSGRVYRGGGMDWHAKYYLKKARKEQSII